MPATATAHRVRIKRTGETVWIERRVGFRGIEYNAGAGWRPTPDASIKVARESGELREATS